MPWNRFFQSTCHVLCRPSETDLHRLKCNTKIPMLQNLWQKLSCDWVLPGPHSDKGWRKVNDYYYAFPIEEITFLSLACNTLDIRRFFCFFNPYSGIHFTQKKMLTSIQYKQFWNNPTSSNVFVLHVFKWRDHSANTSNSNSQLFLFYLFSQVNMNNSYKKKGFPNKSYKITVTNSIISQTIPVKVQNKG